MDANINKHTESVRGMEVSLVEGGPGDVRLTQETFRTANNSIHLGAAADGLEAMASLKPLSAGTSATRPNLILQDLNLPRTDRRQVLAQIKDYAGSRMIPTVILTTSEAESEIANCYQFHASCYLNKPVQFSEFEDLVKVINGFWLTNRKLPHRG